MTIFFYKPEIALKLKFIKLETIKFQIYISCFQASQVALVVKNLPANAGHIRNVGLISVLERPPGGENGNPLQYSRLEYPTDRAAWWATVHRVTKSWTQLK